MVDREPLLKKGTGSGTEDSWLTRWRETLVVTGSFMAAYTAYLAIQSLQSSLNQEAGLGVVSLACLYGTIILSGIFAPSFIRLVGAKWSLVIAWVIHTLYTASNFYPTFATLIPTSILLGGIAGPMWTSSSLYITTSGERMAARSGTDLHEMLSKVNGVFFACYESTQITGNLISSLVLQQSSYETSNNTLTCGADDCPGVGNSSTIAEPEERIVNILLSSYLVCDVIALVLTVTLLPPLVRTVKESDTDTDQGIARTLTSWFTALTDPKLVLLFVFFVSCSMSQGILLVDFTKSYISCSIGIDMVGYIMAVFGVVTSVVALVTIFGGKYTNRYIMFGLSFMCNMAMLLTLLLWEPTPDNRVIYFAISIIWGVAVGIFHTQISALVGLLFPEKMAPAFANYHTWTAIGYTVSFAISGVLCVDVKIYIAVVTFALGMVGYVAAELLYSYQRKAMDKTLNFCQ